MITAELIAYFHDEMETERDADRHGSEVYQVAQSFRDDALDSLSLLVDHKIKSGVYA
ncbi:hypothetical protein [Rathayibacter sp. SD072]|uniref:hypothetical protein n=1 Tax=Rathayibacter sp. SD072 TaxID=2781731 RepID=UPI001A96E7F6|nr:hypothetical protein [Rathayibacter sp. SD072]MBO0983925.1 hypothetical protein [Rathayibacter sp. SD072]